MKTIISCLVVGALAAACTAAQPDPPASSSSASAPTSPPPVTRPLDPGAYATEESVCGLLTDDQAAELGMPRAGTPFRRTDTVLECNRKKSQNERWQADYTLWLGVDLLGEWYASRGDFESRFIEGQPAAVEEADDGWFCNVAARLAERKALQVTGSDSRRKAACSLVIPVAEQIVRNLEG